LLWANAAGFAFFSELRSVSTAEKQALGQEKASNANSASGTKPLCFQRRKPGSRLRKQKDN